MTPVSQLLHLALQHYRKGELEQAEKLYLRVLEVDPHQVEALRIIALVFCRTGRSERAVEFLRFVLRLRPTWADAHNDLGMVQISLKRLGQATASFQEAVRLQPGHAAAHNNLGSALREAGNLAEAASCLQEAVRLLPAYAEAHFNLGLALADQQKLTESLTSFQEAVHLKIEYAEAHLQIGMVLARLGRHAEAAASFEQVLGLQPGNQQARAQLALTRLKTEQHDASETPPRESLCVDSGPVKAQVSQEEAAETTEPLDQVCISNQQSPYGPTVVTPVPDPAVRGVVAPRPLDDPRPSLREALHLTSDRARLHFYLASVLESQGRAESALAHYEQVTRLEPDLAEARLRIARIRSAAGSVDGPTNGSSRLPRPGTPDGDIGDCSLATQSEEHSAATIEEQYARWERDHDLGPVDGAKPSKNDRRYEGRGTRAIGDAALLDVFFGLDANASLSETDQFTLKRLSEWIKDRARQLVQSGKNTVPPHSCGAPSHNGTAS